MKQQTTEGRTHSSVFLKAKTYFKSEKKIKFPITWFCMLFLRTSDFKTLTCLKDSHKTSRFCFNFICVHNIIFAFCKSWQILHIHGNLCMHKYVGSFFEKTQWSQTLYWVALPLKLLLKYYFEQKFRIFQSEAKC